MPRDAVEQNAPVEQLVCGIEKAESVPLTVGFTGQI